MASHTLPVVLCAAFTRRVFVVPCRPTLPVCHALQGEKAASNAGIPFVVVGRKLSADNFRQALIPHLEPNSNEAAALAAAAKEAAAKAAANRAEADAFFRSAVAWKAPRQ